MPTTDNNPNYAQLVKHISPLRFSIGYRPTLGAAASTDIATLIGAALPATIGAVTIVNISVNEITVQNGTATANSAPLPAGDATTLYGDADSLADIELFTAVNSVLGVWIYTTV